MPATATNRPGRTAKLEPDTDVTQARTPAEMGPARDDRRHDARSCLDQPILSVRASLPATDTDAFIAAALRDVRAYMQEHGVSAAGPPFSIRRPQGRTVDVEAGWPTVRPVRGTGRIHSGELPHSLACLGGSANLHEPTV